VTAAERTCRCGEVIEVPKTGRPPRYCTVSCRRSAEYELRRQQALLLRAEKAYQDARLKAATEFGTHWQAAAEWWRQEVERLEDYLEQTLILEEQEREGETPVTTYEGGTSA
jgi:hypothetical protein